MEQEGLYTSRWGTGMQLYYPVGTQMPQRHRLPGPTVPTGKGRIKYMILESLSHVHLTHKVVVGVVFF